VEAATSGDDFEGAAWPARPDEDGDEHAARTDRGEDVADIGRALAVAHVGAADAEIGSSRFPSWRWRLNAEDAAE
jgi:hypothetical protein